MSLLGTYNADNLHAGDYPIVSEGDNVILTGQGTLARGSVLGKITATGKLFLCDTALSDGSEVPYGILGEEADTAAADVTDKPVFLSGEFTSTQLVFGGTTVATDVKELARDKNIYFKSSVIA